MKTVSGISQSTLSKFLQFSLGDKFFDCKLKKARGEFHIIISNAVSKEEEERWISYWKDQSVPLRFLRVTEKES